MRAAEQAEQADQVWSVGGYVNKHGLRVPNPCHEIDMLGRNVSEFERNVETAQALRRFYQEAMDAQTEVGSQDRGAKG
jgi:hypothetical protein